MICIDCLWSVAEKSGWDLMYSFRQAYKVRPLTRARDIDLGGAKGF